MSASDFWSRRRAAVASEEREAQRDADQAVADAAERDWAERPEAELLAEAGQPAPEDLTSPDEVRAFLSSALPQRLKTRALRKLWTLNPVLANVDGLVDYGEDFTDSAMAVEKIQTAYQVGRGMLKHVMRDEVEPAPVGEPEVAAPEDAVSEDVITFDTQMAAEPAEVEPEDSAETEVSQPVGRRRMAFTFDTSPAPESR